MITLRRHDANQAEALRGQLADVYRESWAHSDDPFRSREAFLSRYQAHSRAPGFLLVTAHEAGGELIGYIYGHPLAANTRWWHNTLEPLPPEMTHETGRRTIGVNELHVRPGHRRQGVAHALHDEYLRERDAERAALCVDPSNVVAMAAYRSWGWTIVGQVKPFPDSPVFDILVRDLSA